MNISEESEENEELESSEEYEDLECSEKKKTIRESLAECFGFKRKNTEENLDKTTVDTDKFLKEALESHNAYRQKHGVPNLKLSKELCVYAKEWADYLTSTNTFQHRKERIYGENIYSKWSSDPDFKIAGKNAVDSWYSEIEDFEFGKEPKPLKAGHFTQVIWKTSERVGMGVSKQYDGTIIVVANYDPPGNYIGTYTENVPPPKN